MLLMLERNCTKGTVSRDFSSLFLPLNNFSWSHLTCLERISNWSNISTVMVFLIESSGDSRLSGVFTIPWIRDSLVYSSPGSWTKTLGCTKYSREWICHRVITPCQWSRDSLLYKARVIFYKPVLPLVPNRLRSRTLRCIHHRGVETPQCIHHRGIETPKCIHHQGVKTPRCIHYQGVVLDTWETFNNICKSMPQPLQG